MPPVHFGFVIPGGDLRTFASLAQDAEAAGWDGVFIPDCIDIEAESGPGYDPWVALAAMAVGTERVRLGPMVTAVSRRRPWKLARETVSVDLLSGGRLTLMVGLGALDDAGFGKVGEATDRKTRAELLDEGLAILAGLWSGRPFQFSGKHYQLGEMTFVPPPVQSPRIPIWVVGAWPRERSLRRTLHWDGIIPSRMGDDGQPARMATADIQALRAHITEQRTACGATGPFDIIMEGPTSGDNPEAARTIVRPYADAGVTWWMETMWSPPNGPDDVRQRIQQGPPR